MKKIQKDVTNTGVIIGRFQVDELTDGHIELIGEVCKENNNVVIFIGLSPNKSTLNNPLDFQARKAVIQDKFPDIEVFYIEDKNSDVVWSDDLDSKLKKLGKDPSNTKLYGSRDSFIKYYSGIFPTSELEQKVFTSGTERRKKLIMSMERNIDFRRGVIWASGNRWPALIPAVDVAMFINGMNRILLCKKSNENLYRFVGGFAHPGETYEEAAIRVVHEKTGVEIDFLDHQRSFVINDWRYKNEEDSITSSLFTTEFTNDSRPSPSGDLDELRVFPFNEHLRGAVMEEHIDMLEYLLKLNKRGKALQHYSD